MQREQHMKNNRNYPLYQRETYESMNQMVCAKAEKCKDAPAFQYMRGKRLCSVSYRKFLDDILITGKYLPSQTERPAHVAILGENSYQWLVAFMAVVMSGNVAVPLDKELDSGGIWKQLADSDASLCVCSALYRDIVEVAQQGEGKKEVGFLSMDVLEQLQGFDDTKKSGADYGLLQKWNSSVDKKAMAALFFTSGTSGKSKGVMLSQENMIADINFACGNFYSGGNTFAALPFHHSFGLLTSVFALYNQEHAIFINSSLRHIKRDMLLARPQTMLLVPLFVETFHRIIWQTAKEQGMERKLKMGIALSSFLLKCGIDVRRKLFHSVLDSFGGELTYMICGGAPLQEKYVREFRAIGIEILNGYGITECAPVVAVNRNHYHRDGSVGQILKGCGVRIRTDLDSAVASGACPAPQEPVIGEIQVRGRNVMIGYYRDDKATQEAFEDGWFKTGDLGYIDSDGFLYVTGRKKNLIIFSNGENVSPEELESILLDSELIKEVMVYAEDNLITAEIFPDMDNMEPASADPGNTEAISDAAFLSGRIQNIIDGMNRSLPAYKRIQKLKIRQEPFAKTTTQKIKRRGVADGQ